MYINLLHLHLFNFAYLVFLSFPLNIFVSFVFIALFPPDALLSFCFPACDWVSFVLTSKYNFWFPLFARSIYCVFLGLFSLCSWVCMYMCIFHYVNYYLPDFVTAICLGFIFGFSFLDICFTHPWCHKKPLVKSLFLTRDQTLSLWSGSTDSKTLDYQRINPMEYQIVRTHTKETTWIQDLASPNHQ